MTSHENDLFVPNLSQRLACSYKDGGRLTRRKQGNKRKLKKCSIKILCQILYLFSGTDTSKSGICLDDILKATQWYNSFFQLNNDQVGRFYESHTKS